MLQLLKNCKCQKQLNAMTKPILKVYVLLRTVIAISKERYEKTKHNINKVVS